MYVHTVRSAWWIGWIYGPLIYTEYQLLEVRVQGTDYRKFPLFEKMDNKGRQFTQCPYSSSN